LILAGSRDAREREHNDRAWLAWHIEALRRAKRLPKLDRLLAKQKRRTKQTWQEQMHIMSMWASVMRRATANSKRP
jgi:hypothetical protein